MGGARVILVVGDVMDDLVVARSARSCPRSDTPAHMDRHPGGSGANTAAWLGASAPRCASRAASGWPTCAATRGRWRPAASTRAWRATPARRPGSIVVLAHDRSMFTDRGANLALGRDDLPDDLLEGVDHVHVSGYSLLEEGPRVGGAGPRRARRRAVVGRSRLVTRSSPTRRSWSGPPGASVCFPNEDEARVLGDGIADAYEVVVLKRGHEGVRVLRRGAQPVDVPAATAAAVDQTGAGDAFAAGYLAALVRGEDDAACAAAAGPRGDRGGQPPRRAAAVSGAPGPPPGSNVGLTPS